MQPPRKGLITLKIKVTLSALVYLCSKPPDLAGNDSLKKGKKGCKDAVEFYTKAIEQKCDNAAKNSIFYANRAQAQSVLGNAVNDVKKKTWQDTRTAGNWGRTFEDSKAATDLNQLNGKAWWRAANASVQLGLLSRAVELCDAAVEVSQPFWFLFLTFYLTLYVTGK